MAKPFLQCHHRFKNGKDHCYWSIAEKVRTHRGWVQRHLLYLGEINDSQKAVWTKTVDVFDATRQQTQELALYPADRAIPEHAADYGVQVRLSEFELRRPRQWGACWVGCQLWDQLQLDPFWQERLPDSREGTSWRNWDGNCHPNPHLESRKSENCSRSEFGADLLESIACFQPLAHSSTRQ